ncbi:hypothetical protein [Mitsuokella multacida]|uniref:hypothetical protein n=1 Tax=Mitsuokella multacida TaxID=52226 RepID=UPI0022E80979|nr:hypothetical protein [Mitsuokella multacida]
MGKDSSEEVRCKKELLCQKILQIILQIVDNPTTFLSTIAALCSAVVAILTFYNNEKSSKKAMRSDLYLTISQFVSFANWITIRLRYHDYTNDNLIGLYTSIGSFERDIIDDTKSFFFNDKFDLEVVENVGKAISQYKSWKSFNIIVPEEIFLYLSLLFEAECTVLKTLKQIDAKYANDERVAQMIKPLYSASDENNNIDRSIDHAGKCLDKLKYICNNLTFIFTDENISSELSRRFYTEEIRDDNPGININYLAIRNTIVGKLFLLFLNDMECQGGIHNFQYDNTYHALFDYELQSEMIETDDTSVIDTVRFTRENGPDIVIEKNQLIQDLIGIGNI